MSERLFTGYDPRFEDRAKLRASCIDYDFAKFMCTGEIPPTRGIKDLMTREDQWRMNACGGFGLVHSAQVGWWIATGDFREFNPHWSYRHGQAADGRRGDNGVSIHGVVEAGKKVGLLAQDVENDGSLEFPFVRDQYNFEYPRSAAAIAAQRKIGYSVETNTWDAKLNFLQSNQGGIVTGGSWGNWQPDARGICRKFKPSPRGPFHARAYVDWITIDGEIFLVEANSHFREYGDEGFAYHSREFVEAQDRDPAFVAIGISDITLGPGDKPKQRRPRRFVKLS